MYSSHNYVGPGWNNSAPPPVNASNLQDISNALEDLNITQEQLEQLGASGTLGDILTGNKLYQYAYFRYELIGEPVISNITATPNWGYGTNLTAFSITYGDGYNIDPVTHISTLINQQTEIIYTNNFPQTGHLSGKYIIHERNSSDTVGVPCLINSNSSYGKATSGNYEYLYVTNCTQYNYLNVSLGEAEVFMSPTDTYPHDGVSGDYYYLYIGQPFENALYAKTTLIYAGTGQGTLTLHIPYDFNYIEWIWCSNSSINQKIPVCGKLTKRSNTLYVESLYNGSANANVSISGNDITITNPSSTNIVGTTLNSSNVKYVLAIY